LKRSDAMQILKNITAADTEYASTISRRDTL